MDAHSPDENQKTAATTVLTRRGSEEYTLPLDADNLADRLDWTILHQAAALSQLGRRLSDDLLQSSFEYIDSKDTLGRTPLHWLAETGNADAIRMLTKDPWSANVHVRDNTGFTALHCACWADSFASVAVLLQAGSDPNARDKHLRPPLLQVASPRVLQIMIDKGADVFINDDEGCNIMHHIAIDDQASLAQILLKEYGHKLCTKNYNGDTPLALAVKNNSLDVLATTLPHMRDSPVRMAHFPHDSSVPNKD
jgi:ankyrin repeat protein